METQFEGAQRLYNRRAKVYDNSWHPSFAEHLVRIAAIRPGEHVLDLACGTGLVTFGAATVVGSQGRVTGVDASSGMLEQAKSKLRAQTTRNVDLYQHDISQLGSLEALKGQTFDVITLASALVLLDNPGTAIKSWKSFLRPGGRFVVDVLSPHNMPTGLIFERTAKRLGLRVPYYRNWVESPDSVKALLEEAGLTVSTVVHVEQTGAGVDYLDVADAETLFDKEIESEAYKVLSMDDTRDKARTVFTEEWARVAVDGKVKREDLVWVFVAERQG